MKAIRVVRGSEIIEVALTAAILLGLSIGVVSLFGEQIQKVFQGNSSPLIVSAKMGTSSAGSSTSENKGNYSSSRTNIDANLFYKAGDGQLSAVAQEVTGGDGDGVKLAQAAKASALALLSQAGNALTDVNKSFAAVNNLKDSFSKQTTVLKGITKQTTDITNVLTQLATNLDVLNSMKEETYAMNTDSINTRKLLNEINDKIALDVGSALNYGEDCISLDQAQIDAYNSYVTMSNDYNNSWYSYCAAYDKEGTCTSWGTANSSNYTPAQISNQYSQSQQMLKELEGRQAALKSSIATMKTDTAALKADAQTAKDKAATLQDKALTAMTAAFKQSKEYEKYIASKCPNKGANCIIEASKVAIEKDLVRLTDKSSASNALALLKSSTELNNKAQTLQAQALKLDQQISVGQQTLSSLAANTNLLNKDISKFSTAVLSDNIAQTKTLINDGLAGSITNVKTARADLTKTYDKTVALGKDQQTLIDTISTNLKSTEASAIEAQKAAEALQCTANQALEEAIGILTAGN